MKRCGIGFALVALALANACDGDGANALRIVTASLPDVRLNESYDTKIEVTGGVPPYRFAIDSGELPDGIALKQETGQLTGVAVDPGRAEISVKVTDADGDSARKDLSIYVIPDSLEIVTTLLPQAKEDERYDQTLLARGGVPPYEWSLDAGDLPAGIVLSSDGRIAGTPSSAGSFDFQVKVADSEEGQRLQMLHLFVLSRTPMISTSMLPKARQGQPYSSTLVAEGGTPPYAWEHVGGSLPRGIQLANDGSLTGVAQESGDFAFTARVTDVASLDDMVDLVLRVIPPLEITTTALPQIILGRSIDFTMQSTGGTPPYTWELVGTLPAGVTFEPTGRIYGSSNDLGVSTLTIRVTDSDGFRDSGLFDLRVTDRFTFEVTPNVAFPPSCASSTTPSSLDIEIPVTESFAIADLDVTVELSYTNAAGNPVNNDELKVVLFAPEEQAQAPLCGDGAEIPGGIDCGGFGGFQKTYDDDGGAANRPDRPLSVFDGMNPIGTWILRVTVASPNCNRSGIVERVELGIEDDRSADDYVIVGGYTRNNLLISPWVRITTGNDRALDEHDIYLTATIYSVGPNGRREAGKGDDVPSNVPLTWQLTGIQIPGLTVSNDGHVRAGAITGATEVTASGGGYVINIPLYVVPPDWNPLVRTP